MASDELIDKALLYGEDMALDGGWDFVVARGDEIILQAAQNRVISQLETRKFDDLYWSELASSMETIPTQKVTDDILRTYVEQALLPMIGDGRIQEAIAVTILDRTVNTIFVEIVLRLWTYNGSVVIEVKNFSS